MVELTEKEQAARKRVCLALDVSFHGDALQLVKQLSPYVGMFKVGMELYTASERFGGSIIERIKMQDPSCDIFLDLKFNDIPREVYKTVRNLASRDISLIDVMVSGGREMCLKAVEGAKEGASKSKTVPKIIGVTVLSSFGSDDIRNDGSSSSYDGLLKRRAKNARDWGLDGIVCPANKVGMLQKECGKDWLYVTPGISFQGIAGESQRQTCTPEEAVRNCKNSILVMGSAITSAADKEQRAYEILKTMAQYL